MRFSRQFIKKKTGVSFMRRRFVIGLSVLRAVFAACSLGAEQSVSGIAQSRQDIAVLIQTSVQR